jgi:hypothetical protein
LATIYQAQPKPHRIDVVKPDTTEPEFEDGIKTRGYRQCRFDIELEGEGINELVVKLLFHNSRQKTWFAGSTYAFKSAGQHSITAETRGGTVFLWVDSFKGESFNLSADYSLS